MVFRSPNKTAIEYRNVIFLTLRYSICAGTPRKFFTYIYENLKQVRSAKVGLGRLYYTLLEDS